MLENEQLERTVLELSLKEMAMIIGFKDEWIGNRLMTMGVLPGMSLQLIHKAPMSGGYYLRIDGQNIVLRKVEANSILLSEAAA